MHKKHPHDEALRKVYEALSAVHQYVEQEMNHPDLQMVRLKIATGLKGHITTLNAMTGNQIFDAPKPAGLQPLTHFLGKEIQTREAIKPEQTTVAMSEIEDFISKRDALRNRLMSMTDDQILEYLKEPNGELHLRSVAKKLNITEFQTIPLNVETFDLMRQLITEAEETEEIVLKADNAHAQHVDDDTDEDEEEEEEDTDLDEDFSEEDLEEEEDTEAEEEDDTESDTEAEETEEKPEPEPKNRRSTRRK